MTTKNVTDENFETEILKADKPTLVDFGQNGVVLVNKLVQFLKKFLMR